MQNMSVFFIVLSVNVYAMMGPIRIFTSDNFYRTLEMVLLFFMSVIIVFHILAKPRILFKNKDEFILFSGIVFFYLWGLLLLRTSVDFFSLLKYFRYLATPLICSLLILVSEVSLIEKNSKIKRLGIYIPLVAIFVSIIFSIVQLVKPIIIRDLLIEAGYVELGRLSNFLRGSIHNRLLGGFFDPNILASFMVINIMFVFLDYKNKLNLYKKGIYLLLAALIFVLFFTFSRSGIFALSIAFFIYFIQGLSNRRSQKEIIIFFVIFILTIISLGLYVISDLKIEGELARLYNTRFDFVNNLEEFVTFNGRVNDWGAYMELVSRSILTLLFGIDSSNYVFVETSFENTFISVFFKNGIIGFLLIYLYLYFLFKKAEISYRTKVLIFNIYFFLGLTIDIDILLFISCPLFIYLSLQRNRCST